MNVERSESNNANPYDVAIAGGGLAGLALSIQLVREGYSVALFEKETYPFHKVCGEYISMESWEFLEELGQPLNDWNLPIIRKVLISAPNGASIEQELPLGGFGISRHKIDAALAVFAQTSGVVLYEATKVMDIAFEKSLFHIQTSAGNFQAKVICGTFGKRSNLDVKWKRAFTLKKSTKLNNYIGVKYHVRANLNADVIALHNFKDGYCGISKIEDDRYCLCYMTTAENLHLSGNSIPLMEKNILQKNPFLKKVFSSMEDCYERPLTISQISFEKKNQAENHILFIGDAAGMISPLCGNGMSMSLHGTQIAFRCIDAFLQNHVTRHQMEQQYVDQWKTQFGRRLWVGRQLQRCFGNESRTNFLIHALKPFPKLFSSLIRQTHGQSF
ncbi:FAD-binding protein [Glaciimonas sp. Gout2]|uniref:NAD(P)/FAD-dependent oxidoreductase n=2 Tax=Glaciimonas TaxID=1229970 RepID=UPI002AB403CD|nr:MULTISPECIES: FAD-dependent monooxygenase [unclassified Glaciimonas]MDY7547523.1 FAD-binding protein [Glaciimonas sp. CA11.2]MEB0013491.1 FAD-binding protein [Glaciimonas sp. Cout2]MEB0081570.1 FAD-binding protein [Glaciimonas sp. Gout2]